MSINMLPSPCVYTLPSSHYFASISYFFLPLLLTLLRTPFGALAGVELLLTILFRGRKLEMALTFHPKIIAGTATSAVTSTNRYASY